MINDSENAWMSLLTPQLRKTCWLAWSEQRPLIEIARAHGIGVRAVETRLHRARRRLRAAGITPPDRRQGARRMKTLQLGMTFQV